MLKVWTSSDRFVKIAVPIGIVSETHNPEEWIVRFDPLLRYFLNSDSFVVSLDPISEAYLTDNSHHSDVNSLEISRPPKNSKVKDNIRYDEVHYGSFFDSIQGFWSILHGGNLTLDAPSMMFTQHYVRHKTFKGQASSGTLDLSDGLHDVEFFEEDTFHLLAYSHPISHASFSPSGLLEYDIYELTSPIYDLRPLFDWLSSRGSVEYSYDVEYVDQVTVTLSDFHFSADLTLSFGYHADIIYTISSGEYHHHYDFHYNGGNPHIVSESNDPEHIIDFGIGSRSFGITNHISDDDTSGDFEVNHEEELPFYFVGIPWIDDAKMISQQSLSTRLNSLGHPFWDSVELNLADITALSRDTTTVALNRLSTQAFEPTFGRVGAINPLKVAADSLLAKTADAALKDAQRGTLKEVLKTVGGAGLVKYRTIFSDCLQLINSLEILGEMKNTPSRLYVANAHYDYQVKLGGRDCNIRVRSKAYLILSPFRLIQILIGKQAIVILNDLLALYYSSQPLGEILLTIFQLRKVGDIIGNRMFFDLPLFFVHTYEVESQLNQAELDNTGISNMADDPARLVYYLRDISQYLPVMRFSSLVAFYGTGDVGDVIWTLLQQIAGVLSTGA